MENLLISLIKEEAAKGSTAINLSDKKLTSIPSQVLLLKQLQRF